MLAFKKFVHHEARGDNLTEYRIEEYDSGLVRLQVLDHKRTFFKEVAYFFLRELESTIVTANAVEAFLAGESTDSTSLEFTSKVVNVGKNTSIVHEMIGANDWLYEITDSPSALDKSRMLVNISVTDASKDDQEQTAPLRGHSGSMDMGMAVIAALHLHWS